MKAISTLIVAGCLLGAAPLAQACGMKHGGACGGVHLKEMDTNGDGAISKKEFNAFHDARFKDLDGNKDGKISQDEMGAMHGGMRGKGPMMGGGLMFDQRFAEVDVNGDGALSKDEAEIGMPMLFSNFDAYDTNKDGKITRDEIAASMKQMHEKMNDKCDPKMMKREQK
jgi:Ca2+-binding EF-hand superfamily protein